MSPDVGEPWTLKGPINSWFKIELLVLTPILLLRSRLRWKNMSISRTLISTVVPVSLTFTSLFLEHDSDVDLILRNKKRIRSTPTQEIVNVTLHTN